LAATLGIAMAFTFSCSGDEGKDSDGCVLKQKSSGSGYDVICAGENVGSLQNEEPFIAEKDEPVVTKGDKGDTGAAGQNGTSCTVFY